MATLPWGANPQGQTFPQVEPFKLNLDMRSLGFFQPMNQLGLVARGGFLRPPGNTVLFGGLGEFFFF